MRFLLVLLLFLSSVFSQAQLLYPVDGRYNKKSAQGMAIYGNTAYLMNDGGGCRLLDLKTGKIVKQLQLASSVENPHVNNACFGTELISNGQIPLLYISECRKEKYRCFVESLGDDFKLRQTIIATKRGKIERVLTWVVDGHNSSIYAVTRGSQKLDSLGTVKNTFTKYRLPPLEEGSEIVLTESDKQSSFTVSFPNILQGAKIKDGNLYMLTGLQQTQCERLDSKRALYIINLEAGKLINTVDLTYVTTNEPEDIDFYDGKCLLYCGQEGGIFEIKTE